MKSRAPKLSAPYQRAEQVEITPELARQWVDGRRKNRTISQVSVDRYAHDMNNGRWMVSGEAIKFDMSGKLIDGQHRLLAVLASGVAITSWVIWGLPEEAMDVMDSGRKRSPGDMLSIRGVASPKNTAACCRWLLVIKYGYTSNKTRGAGTTNDEIIGVLERNPGIPDSIEKSHKSKGLAPSLLAAFHYIGSYKLGKPDEADAFALSFTKGVSSNAFYPDASKDPAIMWRERLIDSPKRSTNGTMDESGLNGTILCWNKYAAHEPQNRSFVIPRSKQCITGLDVDEI